MFRFKKSAARAETTKNSKPVVRQVWRPGHAKSNIAGIILNAAAGSGDPTGAALIAYAEGEGAVTSPHPPVLTLPFNEARGMSGNLWHHGAQYQLFVKGAPEEVLARCDLTENENERALTEQNRLAKNGFSVVALAHATLPTQISSFDDLPEKIRFEFDGLVALTKDRKNAFRQRQ